MSHTTPVVEDLQEAKTLMNKAAHDSADWVRQKGGEVAEKAKKAVSTVNDSVHDHPWPIIGGVALGALLLGFILGRRR